MNCCGTNQKETKSYKNKNDEHMNINNNAKNKTNLFWLSLILVIAGLLFWIK